MTVEFHKPEEYLQRGWNVIPANGKKAAIEWKEYQRRRATIDEVRQWFIESRHNVAIVTGEISDLVVVDGDKLEVARKWWKDHPSPLVSKTGKGVHMCYRHPHVEIPNRQGFVDGLDLRGDGGYVIAPPSKHPDGKPYEWLRYTESLDEIPVFDPEWIGIRADRSTVSSTSRAVRNGLAYIMQIRAVSGASGHNDTFRAAVKLAESGLSEVQMLSAMIEWSRTNAEPPWSVQELTHKCIDAYKVVIEKLNEQLVLSDGCRDGSCDIGGRMR